MDTAKPAPRLGLFDVADTFLAGFLLVSGMNAAHFALFVLSDKVAPVLGMFAPLFGITQFLYSGPLVAEFILTGKKKAAMGATVAAALGLLITIIRLAVSPWNEDVYFGYE